MQIIIQFYRISTNSNIKEIWLILKLNIVLNRGVKNHITSVGIKRYSKLV